MRVPFDPKSFNEIDGYKRDLLPVSERKKKKKEKKKYFPPLLFLSRLIQSIHFHKLSTSLFLHLSLPLSPAFNSRLFFCTLCTLCFFLFFSLQVLIRTCLNDVTLDATHNYEVRNF